MKFSLWLEKRMRSQKTATKMPERKSSTELAVHAAGSRMHQMAGQGDSRTYGKSGSSLSDKEKAKSRAHRKAQERRDLKYQD